LHKDKSSEVYKEYCKRRVERVKRWRNNSKQKVVDMMGGCCQICGYKKTTDALELHHVDPSKKEMSFGKWRANPKSLETIKEELKKCILLCANCHREVHAGVTELPTLYHRFEYDT
jgi:5-methylcytosine-specific restriction endonuclease McrA